jgi:hypothetical protein
MAVARDVSTVRKVVADERSTVCRPRWGSAGRPSRNSRMQNKMMENEIQMTVMMFCSSEQSVARQRPSTHDGKAKLAQRERCVFDHFTTAQQRAQDWERIRTAKTDCGHYVVSACYTAVQNRLTTCKSIESRAGSEINQA